MYDKSRIYDGKIDITTNPHYLGKWQMGKHEWAEYGGLKYAPNPARATENEQDDVAHNLYLARGWEPWSCSTLVR